MMPMTSRTASILLLTSITIGCGDSSGPGSAPELPLTLGLKETFLSPRDVQRVALTAYPSPGDSIRYAYLLFGGDIFVDSVALPMAGDYDQVGYVDFTIPIAPIQGTVAVHAVVRTQRSQASLDTVFTIGDDGIPSVALVIWPQVYSPGDTIVPHCSGWDRSGFQEGTVVIHGAIDTMATLTTAVHEQSWDVALIYPIPLSLQNGNELIIGCSLTDIYGHQVSAPVDTITLGQ
jgi:hypothetical protein